jgi:hypothetical protein
MEIGSFHRRAASWIASARWGEWYLSRHSGSSGPRQDEMGNNFARD